MTRPGMAPVDALKALDARIATAVSRFGEQGFACFSISEARAISSAWSKHLQPNETPNQRTTE